MKPLKEIVYEKIVEAKKQDSYLIHQEIWYVIPWMKGTFIHYTTKIIPTGFKILWYLCGTKEPHKWPVQSEEMKLNLGIPAV